MERMLIEQSVKNLEAMAQVLEDASNRQDNYNSDWGHYLAIMARDLRSDANELQNRFALGGF